MAVEDYGEQRVTEADVTSWVERVRGGKRATRGYKPKPDPRTPDRMRPLTGASSEAT